jgi:HPt (histidine-containing phosphotransfer) domain-containing protein
MLTANALSGAKDEYLRNGFDDYIAKPVIYAELEDMIMKYLPRQLQKEQKEEKDIGEKLQDNQIPDQDGFLEDVPEINVKLGMSYCMDTKSFYLEMLEEYLNADKREAFQKAYQEKDWESYRILVHSLKSLSLTIGAEQLSAQAKAMETETKKQNTEYIRIHEEELMHAYAALLEKLRKAVDAEKTKT